MPIAAAGRGTAGGDSEAPQQQRQEGGGRRAKPAGHGGLEAAARTPVSVVPSLTEASAAQPPAAQRGWQLLLMSWSRSQGGKAVEEGEMVQKKSKGRKRQKGAPQRRRPPATPQTFHRFNPPSPGRGSPERRPPHCSPLPLPCDSRSPRPSRRWGWLARPCGLGAVRWWAAARVDSCRVPLLPGHSGGTPGPLPALGGSRRPAWQHDRHTCVPSASLEVDGSGQPVPSALSVASGTQGEARRRPGPGGAGFPFARVGAIQELLQRPQQVPSQAWGHWHVKGEVRLTPAFRVLRG